MRNVTEPETEVKHGHGDAGAACFMDSLLSLRNGN